MFKDASFFEITLFALITTFSFMLYAYVKLGVHDVHESREILSKSVQDYSVENDRFERDHEKSGVLQDDGQNSLNKD